MELRIKDMSFPEAIEFNFDELKQELTEKVEHYKTLVYTDDQVKEAKKDVATLRKFTKALSDERIKIKKECLKPYDAFEAKVKELTTIVDEPISLIDKQVKEYEEVQKQEKMDEIKSLWNEQDVPEGLALEEIFDDKWLNSSTSMKSIQDAIEGSINKFNQDMVTLSNLPEFGFEAQQVYISTLDMNKAISEGHRLSEIQKKKAEFEAQQEKAKQEAEFAKAMNPPEEEIPGQVKFKDAESFDSITETKERPVWIKFRGFMTVSQASLLKNFCDKNGIKLEALQEGETL